jgi:serine/threonine-protein kinase
MSSFTPGDLVGERYEILSAIASGGMATAYLAFDRNRKERVVLKAVHFEQLSNGALLQKFFREFKILSKLSHQNIVTVYEAGEAPISSLKVSLPYYTMEYLKSIPLSKYIIETSDRSSKEYLSLCISYLVQIGEALQHAHDQGIVYSDLTPNNVLLLNDTASLKIIDFGLSRIIEAQDAVDMDLELGTPAYMSPEQYSKGRLDHRSDIYSFGVLAFELLTGEQPYKPENIGQTEFFHKLAAIPSPRTKNKQIPNILDRLIVRCMEKEPRDRLQSMEQVLRIIKKVDISLSNPNSISRLLTHVQRLIKPLSSPS